VIEEAILREEEDGYRTRADWHRINLAEVYLQILGRNERAPLPIILRNLPILLKVMFTAGSRIRTLIARVLENPHRRILSQFGQTPILARVETALAELGT
jgi:hypothetical protein